MDLASIASVLGGGAVFITSLTGAWQARTASKRIAENTQVTYGVHDLVNGQRTELVDRVAQLADMIRASGLNVPPRPEAEPDGPAAGGERRPRGDADC
jgi:hypothetical protein